jgi:hypothetical protein
LLDLAKIERNVYGRRRAGEIVGLKRKFLAGDRFPYGRTWIITLYCWPPLLSCQRSASPPPSPVRLRKSHGFARPISDSESGSGKHGQHRPPYAMGGDGDGLQVQAQFSKKAWKDDVSSLLQLDCCTHDAALTGGTYILHTLLGWHYTSAGCPLSWPLGYSWFSGTGKGKLGTGDWGLLGTRDERLAGGWRERSGGTVSAIAHAV